MLFIEPLVAWGVVNAVGFVFKPIMEKFASLATDALEDCVKEFFGVYIQDILDPAKLYSYKKAFGKAQKEFLELVQLELGDHLETDEEIKEYETALDEFICHPEVRKQLGKPFQKALGNITTEADGLIDNKILVQLWHDLNLKALPDDFSWQKLVNRYVKKVPYILQDFDQQRELLDSQNLTRIVEAIEQLVPPTPGFDLGRYQKGLFNSYKRLDLDSLDTDSYKYDSLELWNIFIPQNLLREGQTSSDILSVLNVLNKQNDSSQNHQYTVILGNPGSGKSTLARYKVLEWARIPIKDSELQDLPLLIELRNYIENRKNPDCHDFMGYFENGIGIRGGKLAQNKLDEWLKNHPSIVIFDGLDEVLDPGERENVAEDIINFTTTYPQARVLVTSRVVGYDQQRRKFQNANFSHFMLQDLNQEQIEGFITQWHKLAFADQYEGNKKRDRLLNCINNSRAFRELAGNPLLLTMMAILNRHEELPRDRATLYENASKVLLHKWDKGKNIGTDKIRLEDYNKVEMLRKIAFEIQSNATVVRNSLIITKQPLDEIISEYLKSIGIQDYYEKAQELREQLTNRSFILCFLGGDSYGFVHRTFLEYFCASHFHYEYERKKSKSLEQLKTEVIIQQWTDPAWREVIILFTGLINESFAAELIDCLAEQDGQSHNFDNLILAAECLQNVRNRYPIRETDKRLLDKIKDLLENQPQLTDEVRNQAIAVIKTTWTDDSETLQWLAALDQ